MTVPLGQPHRITYDLYDATDVLTNAGTVTLAITLPDGTAASLPAVVNPPTSTGRYYLDYVPVQAGRHVARWTTTGPTTAKVDLFNVDPSDPGWLVSLSDVKDHLGITNTASDDEIAPMLAAATKAIEHYTGPMVRRTVTEIITPAGYRATAIFLTTTPVISVTSAVPVAGGSGLTVGGLTVNADTGQVSYTTGWGVFPYAPYLWTWVAGRVVIPADAQLAELELIRHLWRSQRGAAGVPWQGGEEGEPAATLPYALPHGVRELLTPYLRSPSVA